MAVYDPEAKKLVVRVVYDGPGKAGKTTNLQQLCSFFTRQRRSELYTGTTAAERTLCLDWLQLDGGLVQGHELRCHLLTVPGQAVLSRRRQLLLSLADATIFVLESTPAGLEEARPMWLSMLACTGGLDAGVPVVVQANKQDQPGALDPGEIRARWAIDARVPIIAAEATRGSGVRETVVLAIRATALALQEQLQASAIGDLEGHYETGEELERRILELEVARPMSALDVVLSAHRMGRTSDPPRAGAALALEHDSAPRDGRSAPTVPPSAPSLPPLPDADMPHGLVWPPAEGRKALRRVPLADAVLRMDVSRALERDPFARELVFEAGIWRLSTSPERCYEHADVARRELVRLAHLQLELGSLRVPRTVLAVQSDVTGRFWLWTVRLWLTTLRNQMTYAAEAEDEAALAAALALYADLASRALRACLENELVLDLEPDQFGVLSGEGFYLRDDIERGTCAPRAAAALLGRFDEYATHDQALATYEAALLERLSNDFRPDELEQLGLLAGLEAAAARSSRAAAARCALLRIGQAR